MTLPPLFRIAGLIVLVMIGGCAGMPINDCNLTRIAQMPMEVQDQLLVVPVGINGQWVRLIVDTGAERTTISDAAAKRLGLPNDPKHITQSLAIGGATTTLDVTIDRLVMGGVHFPIDRIAVGTFTLQTQAGLKADGLLGADLLLGFDMDIDVSGQALTLYRSRVCAEAQPPWKERAIEIAGVRARRDRLLLPFELDSVGGTAILDTGAQRNLVGLQFAQRMGLTAQAMEGDPMVRQRGAGPEVTMAPMHRFKLMRIGPVAQNEPVLTVLPSDFGVGDALIGQEFFNGRQIWLSFKNRQVFVSARESER